MKFSSIACGVIFCSVVSSVAAEEEKFSAGVFVESLGPGANFSYKFADEWSARIEFADQNKLDAKRYGVDGLYHIDNGPVYAFAGLKQLDLTDSITLSNIGFGISPEIFDNVNLIVESAWYEGLGDSYSEFGLKLGVRYLFGGERESATVKKAATVAVIDSDNDGIEDAKDKCSSTPSIDAVDSHGCTLFEEKSVSIRLLVNFPHNSSVVGLNQFDDIDNIAKFLKQYPETDITLEGYSSSVGDAEYNLALSKRRAKAVSKILIKEHSIDSSRVKTVAYGETKLKALGTSEESNAKNRRVEAFSTTVIKVNVTR